MIPLKEQRTTEVFELKYIGEVIGKAETKPTDWYSLGFEMNEGDTVVAARSGRVIEIEDNIIVENSEALSFKEKRNYVEILHKDGTIGKYELFQKGGIFVRPGDNIIAGEAIGIIDGTQYTSGAHVRFHVYYAKKEGGYGYVPLKFYVNDKISSLKVGASYEVSHSESIIEEELTKKQKKRRKH